MILLSPARIAHSGQQEKNTGLPLFFEAWRKIRDMYRRRALT
jgi:hypothetical protein